jgi:diaminohydroxyphosphoribosylaminopyrimidine deaminase/5-amino-6-(5-phosphoribosylamino)uracil reductase
MSVNNEKFMEMALRLAKRGISSVEPNPAVGAIIIKANQIIGRGWHKKFGGPHAEINALVDCQSLGVTPNGATMYVTLEPCSHKGKTGPCTQAIISAGISKVFVAMTDPSQHANGKGIEQLRQAGIEVHVGICETKARLLNAPFIKYTTTGKCWVTLKWAQSIDGKVAWADGIDDRRWISNEQSRRDVHKLRRRAQAILVGINTIVADDPLLTARPNKGRIATRIVMDSYLKIPPDCRLITTVNQSPVIIFTSQNSIQAKPHVAEELLTKGVELLAYPSTGRSNLHFLIAVLSNRGISQLLVEGGPTVLTSFLRENLADEIIVYISPKILGPQSSVGITGPMAELSQAVGLYNVEVDRFGDNVRFRGMTEKAMEEISSTSESSFEIYTVSEPVNEQEAGSQTGG